MKFEMRYERHTNLNGLNVVDDSGFERESGRENITENNGFQIYRDLSSDALGGAIGESLETCSVVS